MGPGGNMDVMRAKLVVQLIVIINVNNWVMIVDTVMLVTVAVISQRLVILALNTNANVGVGARELIALPLVQIRLTIVAAALLGVINSLLVAVILFGIVASIKVRKANVQDRILINRIVIVLKLQAVQLLIFAVEFMNAKGITRYVMVALVSGAITL